MKNKKITSQDSIWIHITLIIMLYVVFLILKINGVWDWTRSYDIESISCRELYNRVLVIDKDELTTWGVINDDHSQGEKFTIKFCKLKSVRGISVTNNTSNESKEINIYYSLNGVDYIPCNCLIESDNNTIRYILGDEIKCQWLQLEYSSAESGKWPITEIEIYD